VTVDTVMLSHADVGLNLDDKS